jgi:hypothetical protein
MTAGLSVVGAQDRRTLADAQRDFYNARYAGAAAVVLKLRESEAQDLPNDELRTSALLFELKALLEIPSEKDARKNNALSDCSPCPALITAFLDDVHHGQRLARERLASDPEDAQALFFLGKLDLNYVWLQLGPLGRKTGWDEYWEARHALDALIRTHPQDVRGIVARAWIDYIVDTKMPWGTRWVLGGGSRKRALAAMTDAVRIETDVFSHAEARFALWDLRVREHDVAGALAIARTLAHDFPDNREVAEFLEARDTTR